MGKIINVRASNDLDMHNYLSGYNGYNRKKRVPKKSKQRCRKTQTAKYQSTAKYLIRLIYCVMMKEYEGISYKGINSKITRQNWRVRVYYRHNKTKVAFYVKQI